jgi:3-oxoacyl-[acyl-carrier-protein] synthase II
MTRRRVLVSGYGALTGFGLGAACLRRALFDGEHAFVPVTRFETTAYRSKLAAQSNYRQDEVAACVDCVREALAMSGCDPANAALLLGTSGDVAALDRFWSQSRNTEAAGDDALGSAPAVMVETIAQKLGIVGRRLAFTNACVASTSALAYAGELISSGREDTVVCGGSSLLSQVFFALFDAGRAMSPRGRLRPFARDRDGLLLGDGVAFLVLESEQHLRARRGTALAELAGWGISSDAFHVCQPDPSGQGLARAAQQALRRAGVEPHAVGYVNAHGTGTPLNDRAESNALRLVFGDQASRVPLSSTKGATGHTLEAAGAVEAVIGLLALTEHKLPPCVGLEEPDPECGALDLVTKTRAAPSLDNVLSLNAAFGGVNAALLLRRAPQPSWEAAP